MAVSMDVDNEEEMGVEAISGTGGAAEVLYSKTWCVRNRGF